MPISIHLLKLEQLKSLRAGSTQVDGFRVMPGAAYEPDTIDYAIERVREGRNPVWHSMYLIIDDNGRNAIGTCAYHATPDHGRVEIGYGVAPDFRGNGAATEASRLLIKMAFKHKFVTEVFARSHPDNIASRRVLEKVGFKHIGQAMYAEHGLVDQWIYYRPS